MSTDEIKLNYPLAEDMARAFKDGAQQLEETMQELENLAAMLENGALLGRGGTAFVQALRGKMVPAVTRLTEKFRELEGDVNVAVAAMQNADAKAEGRF